MRCKCSRKEELWQSQPTPPLSFPTLSFSSSRDSPVPPRTSGSKKTPGCSMLSPLGEEREVSEVGGERRGGSTWDCSQIKTCFLLSQLKSLPAGTSDMASSHTGQLGKG